MSSLLNTVGPEPGAAIETLLADWAGAMVDKHLSTSTRKRYIEKLHSLYRQFAPDCTADPFQAILPLGEADTVTPCRIIESQADTLIKISGSIIADATSRPEAAIFLYLLLNASANIDHAARLTISDFNPDPVQLADIISPDNLHHRRKYLFSLNQNRKRPAQLTREISAAIADYLTSKGLNFQGTFSPLSIVALWIAAARRAGIKSATIARIVAPLPAEYAYLAHLSNASALTPDKISSVKQRVADLLAPTRRNWYALKMRRNVPFPTLSATVSQTLAEAFTPSTLFYPQKETSKRIDKKITTELTPVIPDVVFFNVAPQGVQLIDNAIKARRLGWVFRLINAPGSPYSIIDRQSMYTFQRMIGSFSSDIRLNLAKSSSIGIGRRVRITGGIMAGYIGIIHDIKTPDSTDLRQIDIRLSDTHAIKATLRIDESLVDPLP